MNKFGELAKCRIMESPRRQSKFGRLFNHRLYDGRVAMALVDCPTDREPTEQAEGTS